MSGKGGKRFWGLGSRKNSAIAYGDSSQLNPTGAASVEENKEGDDDVTNGESPPAASPNKGDDARRLDGKKQAADSYRSRTL